MQLAGRGPNTLESMLMGLKSAKQSGRQAMAYNSEAARANFHLRPVAFRSRRNR